MHDAVPVRGVERLRDLDPVAQRQLERQRAARRQPVGQRLALQVLHDQVGGRVLVADVVERADVGMRELRDGARLALEALADSGDDERWAGRTLTATVRSRRVSRAR